MAYYTRLIDAELMAWKDKNKRKPLLMRGARQVGKTWLQKEHIASNDAPSTGHQNEI